MLVLLLGPTLAQATGRKLVEPYEYVAAVECNTFGDGAGRTALVFRDKNDDIIDWRWYDPKQHRPHKLPSGKWLLIFEDDKQLHVLLIDDIYSTRTDYDVEVRERAKLPHEARRKLGGRR